MSANNNNNTSTLKSYVDSATGAVQNVVGSIIGSTGDEVSIHYSRGISLPWTNTR